MTEEQKTTSQGLYSMLILGRQSVGFVVTATRTFLPPLDLREATFDGRTT